MSKIGKMLTDPTFWFVVVFVGTIVGIMAGLIIAKINKHILERTQKNKVLYLTRAFLIAKDPTLLIIEHIYLVFLFLVTITLGLFLLGGSLYLEYTKITSGAVSITIAIVSLVFGLLGLISAVFLNIQIRVCSEAKKLQEFVVDQNTTVNELIKALKKKYNADEN